MNRIEKKIPEELQSQSIVLLGIPFDENSSFMRGAAQAPKCIREALYSGSANWCVENGMNIGEDPRWKDIGDMVFSDTKPIFDQIEEKMFSLMKDGKRILSIGGDHSITYPIIRAFAKKNSSLTILQLDAHPDMYDELNGNRYSHACPFARIMEEELVKRLIQLGIRTMTPFQREQGLRFGVETHQMRDWPLGAPLNISGPVYLSIDIDCLDPAFAPGVSHHEPGGFTSREVFGIIRDIKAPIVGADIVEYNPARDSVGMTAMVAAKLLKEVIASMLQL